MTKRTETNGEVSRKRVLARVSPDLSQMFDDIQAFVDNAFVVENAALIAERDALAVQNEAALVTIDMLQAQIDGKDVIIAQQIVEIAAKNTEIATLRWDLELESERRLELESQVADLQDDINELSAQILTLQAQIADLQAQLAAATVFPVVASVSDLTVNETTASAVFTVTLDRTSTRSVNIDYTTVNGTATAGQDYTATSGILVIPPGALSAQVSVPIINDANVEGNEAFTLSLSNPRLSLAMNDSTGSGTIISEDVTQPPPPTGSIPLTYGDARFAGNTTSNSITQSGGTIANKSITDTGNAASIVQTGGTLIVQTCRINSRECIRVTSGVDVRNCYLEATGTGDDHADVIQAYSPGQSNGIIKCTDTAIVAHNTAATAGLFVADSWGGTVTLKNVLFQGGPYGCRIHADPGKTVNVSLEDVYFVGPFFWNAILINKVGTGILNITKWVNVRNATIVGGVLVPGSLIPSP